MYSQFKYFLLFVWLITGSFAYAQNNRIEGKVTDDQNAALPAASVLLLQPRDSSIFAYTVTDTSGLFELKNINSGEFILKITYLSFAPYLKAIVASSDTDKLNMGTIVLKPVTIKLKEVTVTGAKDEVVIKKDTLEYNAGSFGTQPNANVEQLLKKLPGLDVERDGNISVQGENVTKIFVDGKEFFGGNLKMATRNLPADAIDKVQVIDGKSEEARFSGIDDGRRQKVINLTLKEDRRNMGFGKATAGIGTNNRYMAQGNYNRLENDNMMTVTGMSNNINNQGLSSDGSSVGPQAGSGGGNTPGRQNGLASTHMGGLNAFKALTPKTKINGSYLLNYSGVNIENNLTRQNFLPDGTALYYENSLQRNSNGMHNATAGLEHNDSINTFRLSTNFNFSDAFTSGNSNRQSYSVADSLVNEGERTSTAQNKNMNLNTELFYGHRFGKSGRLFTITNQFSTFEDNATGRSESFTRFINEFEEDLKQRNKQQSNDLNFSSRLAYTEPLGNKQYLQTYYQVSNRASRSNLEVFDIVNETSQVNDEQSSKYSLGYIYQQLGLTYRLNRSKYTLAVGTNVQQSELSRTIGVPGEEVKLRFRNALPNLHFNMQLNKATRLNFDYSTAVTEPAIDQLQPVISRFDPLHQYIGNPGLRPAYTHQGKLVFNTSAVQKRIFLSSSLTFNYTTNPITAAVTIDENQVRTTQYVNVRESNTLGAFVNIGFPVKKINSRFNFSPYLRQGQSVNLLNGIAGSVKQRSAGGNFGYTYRFKEFIDFNLRTLLAITNADYALNKNQSQTFVTSAYMSDATVHFLKKFNLTAEFNYNRFRNAGANFNQAVPILNFSLSRYVLKDNKGEVKLSGLNLLNRNVGISQFATLNYIEQSVQNALGNFYMLSFTYNFNRK
jgi:hypothetical protein